MELIAARAGEAACPLELRGHVCTWLWIMDVWGEEEPAFFQMCTTLAGVPNH